MNRVRSYFDLSRALLPAKQDAGAADGAERVQPESTAAAGELARARVGAAWQLAIYLVLAASIVASRYVDLYRAGIPEQFAIDRYYVVFVAIMAMLAFPVVYDRAQLSRQRPLLLQLVLIFSAGMGWEKLVATALGK